MFCVGRCSGMSSKVLRARQAGKGSGTISRFQGKDAPQPCGHGQAACGASRTLQLCEGDDSTQTAETVAVGCISCAGSCSDGVANLVAMMRKPLGRWEDARESAMRWDAGR